MSDRRERHATHPWLTARQRAQIDFPPDAKDSSLMSAARQDLEDAFGPPPAPASASASCLTTESGSPPDVVIKRKRAFVAPGVLPVSDGSSDSARASAVGETVQADKDRAPRVFRVDPPVLAFGKLDSPERAVNALTADGSPAVPADLHPLSTIPTRKPRRRVAPAVVTFVAHQQAAADRPLVASGADKSPAVEAAGHLARMPLPFTAVRRFDTLLQRLERLEHVFSQIREAQDFHLSIRDSRTGSYLALRETIQELERNAQIVRKVEASRAITWIKRAIGEYGLTAADLGL
jgi:hypothetical protein